MFSDLLELSTSAEICWTPTEKKLCQLPVSQMGAEGPRFKLSSELSPDSTAYHCLVRETRISTSSRVKDPLPLFHVVEKSWLLHCVQCKTCFKALPCFGGFGNCFIEI